MRIYHRFESEEKGRRVYSRFKEHNTSRNCAVSHNFHQKYNEVKSKYDKYANDGQCRAQSKRPFLRRKRKAEDWPKRHPSMGRLYSARNRTFEQTFEEAKQVCEPKNANKTNNVTKCHLKAPIRTLFEDDSLLQKTAVCNQGQGANRNNSRLVRPVKLLYPPSQIAPTIPPTVLYSQPSEFNGSRTSVASARVVIDIAAQRLAINVPYHQVTLVPAQKAVSHSFIAFAPNGKRINSTANNYRPLLTRTNGFDYDNVCHRRKIESKTNAQTQRPLRPRANRRLCSPRDLCKKILESAKIHLCDSDYLQLLALLGEVWRATKTIDIERDDWMRESLLLTMRKMKQLLRGGCVLQAIKTLVEKNPAMAWAVEDW